MAKPLPKAPAPGTGALLVRFQLIGVGKMQTLAAQHRLPENSLGSLLITVASNRHPQMDGRTFVSCRMPSDLTLSAATWKVLLFSTLMVLSHFHVTLTLCCWPLLPQGLCTSHALAWSTLPRLCAPLVCTCPSAHPVGLPVCAIFPL